MTTHGDWEYWYRTGPTTIMIIEEQPLAHPPGFVPIRDPEPPKNPQPNCRIRKVTFK